MVAVVGPGPHDPREAPRWDPHDLLLFHRAAGPQGSHQACQVSAWVADLSSSCCRSPWGPWGRAWGRPCEVGADGGPSLLGQGSQGSRPSFQGACLGGAEGRAQDDLPSGWDHEGHPCDVGPWVRPRLRHPSCEEGDRGGVQGVLRDGDWGHLGGAHYP